MGCRGLIRVAGSSAFLLVAIQIAGCKTKAPANPEAAPTPASAASSSSSSSQSSSSQQSGSLLDRLGSVESGQTGAASKPSLPDWKPAPAGASSPAIPLEKNLIVVTAVSTGDGDYESYKQIAAVTPAQVRLDYSAVTPVPVPPGTPAPPPDQRKTKSTSCTRLIDVADLASAHAYNETFCGNRANPEHFPGSTAISASTELLNQLRANQPTDFHFANTQGNLLTLLGQLAGNKSMGDMLHNATAAQDKGVLPGMSNCTLHRVEASDLLVPVLLNDQPVELPAIHASCTTADNVEAHLYYLDQPSNPITLAFQIGSEKSRLQVIKIIFPPPPPPAGSSGGGGAQAGGGGQGSQMEQALAQKKPVEIYGIYFDFNSSVIKPESEVVLRQIATIMQKNPDWKLSVSGHTDNIGDDNFNLGLSQRRAAAVKDALVTRYKIAPDRLVTAGYGASQPIDTNKTLEGRARNRRVELQRQ